MVGWHFRSSVKMLKSLAVVVSACFVFAGYNFPCVLPREPLRTLNPTLYLRHFQLSVILPFIHPNISFQMTGTTLLHIKCSVFNQRVKQHTRSYLSVDCIIKQIMLQVKSTTQEQLYGSHCNFIQVIAATSLSLLNTFSLIPYVVN